MVDEKKLVGDRRLGASTATAAAEKVEQLGHDLKRAERELLQTIHNEQPAGAGGEEARADG